MNYRQRALLLIVLLAACCGALLWGVSRWRARAFGSTQALLERLPNTRAALVYVDCKALRQAGILEWLSPAGVPLESEYKAFLDSTGFDYTRDLDTAIVSFAPDGKYFLLRGRFHWPRLFAYARQNGGKCNYTFCELEGSSAERRISYFPLQSDLMALAVSPDDDGAARLRDRRAGGGMAIPAEPVWVSLPGPLLGAAGTLPEGTRMFATSLAGSQRVTLALGPRGQAFEAHLEVLCRSPQDAAALEAQLGRITALLRDMIAREHQSPNPRDLSGVLTAGQFRHAGTRVMGVWPVSRGFLQQLLGAS